MSSAGRQTNAARSRDYRRRPPWMVTLTGNVKNAEMMKIASCYKQPSLYTWSTYITRPCPAPLTSTQHVHLFQDIHDMRLKGTRN
jgi:hypothetical protein